MVSLWSGGSLWYSVLSSRDCRVNECIEKVYFLPTSNSLQYLIKHYYSEALMVIHLKMYKQTNTLTSWWNIRTSTHLVWNILTQMFHVSDDNNFLFLQQIWSLQTALIILEFSPLGLWCRWCPGWERREVARSHQPPVCSTGLVLTLVWDQNLSRCQLQPTVENSWDW